MQSALPGQSIPAGLLVMFPPPVPLVPTVSSGKRFALAVTSLSEVISSTQVPVPEHAPPHPVNDEVESGVAVSVTEVPAGKLNEHTVPPFPQLIPAGELVTLPAPVP